MEEYATRPGARAKRREVALGRPGFEPGRIARMAEFKAIPRPKKIHAEASGRSTLSGFATLSIIPSFAHTSCQNKEQGIVNTSNRIRSCTVVENLGAIVQESPPRNAGIRDDLCATNNEAFTKKDQRNACFLDCV
jgi:hypothetical protein